MLMNTATQVILNEIRKTKSKIENKKRELKKLEAELHELEQFLKK